MAQQKQAPYYFDKFILGDDAEITREQFLWFIMQDLMGHGYIITNWFCDEVSAGFMVEFNGLSPVLCDKIVASYFGGDEIETTTEDSPKNMVYPH